jgi:hypothetical protein
LCYIKYASVVCRDLKNSSTYKAPLAKSRRVGDMLCCRLNIESCAKEASRLQSFYTGDLVEVCVKRNGSMMVLDFPDFSAFLASFSAAVLASLKALSLALLASFSTFSMAFLASLVLLLLGK